MSSECKLLNIILCCGLPAFFAVFSSVANSGHKPEMVICLEKEDEMALGLCQSQQFWNHQEGLDLISLSLK
jgi:hypothetical protein